MNEETLGIYGVLIKEHMLKVYSKCDFGEFEGDMIMKLTYADGYTLTFKLGRTDEDEE